MLRLSVCSLAVFALLAGAALAADQKKEDTKDHNTNKAQKAKVVNVNPKDGTITLEMKDRDGKETKRTFHLTEDVRVLDENTGKVAALDVFQSGDEVLFVEAEGKLKELHRNKHGAGTAEHNTNKNENKTPESKSKDNKSK